MNVDVLIAFVLFCRYEEFGEDDVSFEMLPDNISLVSE